MRKWSIGVVAVLGVATCLTAGSALGARSANPKWVTIPWLSNLGFAPLVVGSASDRGWIGFERGNGSLALASLRTAGGRLSLAKAQALHTSGETARIVGSQLVYRPELGAELRTVPLLENGMLGSPSALPGHPEGVPPRGLQPRVVAGIHVAERTVWLLTGGTGAKGYLWACCSRAGALGDLTRLIQQGRGMLFWQLGLDAGGRLWVAWLQHGAAVLGAVRIVELDPTTLAPRTPVALAVPNSGTSTRFELTCAAVCRVVMSRLGGDIVSWSPGERSPTRLAAGTRTNPANLLAASYRSGGLVVAYSRSRSISPLKAPVIAIRVVRGDSRGAHPRRVGSVDIPTVINRTDFINQTNYGTFTADGLAFFATYDGSRTRVNGGLVPVAP